jgi:hypothetical protein
MENHLHDNTSNDNLPPNVEETILEEVCNEINNIGNIDDINQQIPDKKTLDDLKKMIDSMPREQVTQLLSNLAKNGKNAINPNNNSFSAVDKKEMLQMKLKQKRNQYKMQRMTKNAKDAKYKQYSDKLNTTQ